MKRRCRRFLAVLLPGILAINMVSSAFASEDEAKGVPPAEAPVQAQTEAPAEAQTEAPTEAPEEVPTEAPTETPEEVPTEAPTEPPAEPPTEAQTEAPTEIQTETSAESPAETSTETFTDAAEENTEGGGEDAAKTDEKTELSVAFSVKSNLGENCLKAEENNFAETLYTDEDAARGGQGTVTLYADFAKTLLEEEGQKGEAHKLTGEERTAIEQEQAVLAAWLEENGYAKAQYFVLRLKKALEGEEPERIHESRESLRMILEMAGQPSDAAEAVLIYVKNGQAEVCSDLDQSSGTITFESGTFGTYALAYRFGEQTAEEENRLQPETGQETADIEIETAEENAVYRKGSKGTWNPATHRYENRTAGEWVYENGGNAVVLKNNGTQDVSLILLYRPSGSHSEIKGSFTDAEGRAVRKIKISAGTSVTVYLKLSGEPAAGMQGETIGTVTYQLAKEE